MDYSTDLYVSLNDWHHMKAPSFQMSAIYVFEFLNQQVMQPKNENSNTNNTNNSNNSGILAIAFAGSYRGEVARFYLYENDSVPVSCSFGHFSKIVEFAPCKLPIIMNAVASLSVDGTICIWNIRDGICVNRFERLLPNGCQHISISQKAIELCVVSGAFTSLYVVNIQEGKIIQQIHPCNSFTVGLSFYSAGKCAWLFAMDSSGCATYTSLTPSTAKSHKIRLFVPKQKGDFVLSAQPNSDFSYLFVTTSNTIEIIDLTEAGFPSKHIDTEFPISKVVWVDNYTLGFIQMNGHFSAFKFPSPNSGATHENVISKLIETSAASIDSSLANKINKTISEIAVSNELLLDPFSNVHKKSILLSVSSQSQALNNGTSSDVKLTFDGTAELENPVISGFGGQLVIGFEDTISVVKHDMKECSISSVFGSNNGENNGNENSKKNSKKSSKQVTAQCYVCQNGEVTMLVEGNTDGTVIVRFLMQNRKKIKLHHSHKGKIVALFSTNKYIFTSGTDCLVHVYDISHKFHLVNTYCHFTSPVTAFYRTSKHTQTDIDHCIFCSSKKNVVSMIDLKDLQNKRVFFGHDSHVHNIWFHPPTKILLIECNSLYFWSLVSGNLESILNGNKKESFIRNMSEHFIPVLPLTKNKKGIILKPLKIGSLSFQVPLVHIKTVSELARDVVQKNVGITINQLVQLIPNFPLVFELLSERTRHFLKEHSNSTVPSDSVVSSSDSLASATTVPTPSLSKSVSFDEFDKKFDVHNMKNRFTIGFVGKSNVPTLFFPSFKLTNKTRWQISPLVSSIMLGTRAMFAVALRNHLLIVNSWQKLFKLDPQDVATHIVDFQPPSLFHLMRFIFCCSTEIHDFLLHLISCYPLDSRRDWLKKLKKSAIQFPNYKHIFAFIGCSLAETMLSEISKSQLEDDVNDLLEVIGSVDVGPYAREMIAREIDIFIKNLSKENMITIINKVAENATKNCSDEFSLALLFKKQTELCLQIAQDNVHHGKAKISFVILNEVINSISLTTTLQQLISTQLFDKTIECLLMGLDKLPQEETTKLLRRINDATMKWLSYSPISHSIAFGTSDGCVSVLMNFKQTTRIKAKINLANSLIEVVEFDPSGWFILAQCSAEKKICVISIEVSKGEDKNSLNLKTSHSKSYELMPKAKWKTEKQLEIDDPNTKVISSLAFSGPNQ